MPQQQALSRPVLHTVHKRVDCPLLPQVPDYVFLEDGKVLIGTNQAW